MTNHQETRQDMATGSERMRWKRESYTYCGSGNAQTRWAYSADGYEVQPEGHGRSLRYHVTLGGDHVSYQYTVKAAKHAAHLHNEPKAPG